MIPPIERAGDRVLVRASATDILVSSEGRANGKVVVLVCICIVFGGASKIAFHMIPPIERAGGRVLVRAPVTDILINSDGRANGKVCCISVYVYYNGGAIEIAYHMIPPIEKAGGQVGGCLLGHHSQTYWLIVMAEPMVMFVVLVCMCIIMEGPSRSATI